MLLLVKLPSKWCMEESPPNLLSYVPGTSKVEVVDNMLQARDKVVKDLRCQLQQAQARMKTAYEQGRVKREFVVGDWVSVATTLLVNFVGFETVT